MKVYLDGEPITPELMLKFADGKGHQLIITYDPPEANGPISMGITFQSGTTSRPGFVSYDKAMSAEEVKELYDIGRGHQGLEDKDGS